MPLKNTKALLIVNPKAGKLGAKTNLFTIISTLSQKYTLTVHLTEYSGDAIDTAAQAENFDTIICCGGDGTVSQVLEGISTYERPVNIGYIPCGTTNDLATALGIPKNIPEAAQAVVDGIPIPHDVGQFGKKHRFVYTATFGAFAATSYSTPQDMKNVFGHFAYLLAGAGEIWNIRNYKTKITYDDGEFSASDVLLCAVLNSTSVGGILKLPKDNIDFSDGKFEILVIRRPPDAIALSELISALMKSDYNNPYIEFLKTSSCRIETADPAAWSIDGEAAGEHKTVDIRCLHQAVNFIRTVGEKPMIEGKNEE